MRRDFFIENDSGGFSVIAGDALDAVIEDQRSDDMAFVAGFKVLLLELYGDDSMPVRIVVDEPLRADEEEQWLARASWRIDATDGRLIVMGGFDPDVLSSWKDETGGTTDGRGVAITEVPSGSLRVDVYAHAGSMNGREILGEAKLKPGAAFRRSHPQRPFPLWLATCSMATVIRTRVTKTSGMTFAPASNPASWLLIPRRPRSSAFWSTSRRTASLRVSRLKAAGSRAM